MSDIIVLAGSTAKNMTLADTIAQECRRHDLTTEVINLAELNLPLFTPLVDTTAEKENITALAKTLRQARGLVFVAPEYNGGIPPVVTNFITWMSISGQDWRECFNAKTALLATHSGGGGVRFLEALRTQLAYIGMNVIGRVLLTSGQKPLNPASLQAVVDQLRRLI